MGISDRARNALRAVFGVERDERDRAESPSGEALRATPSSTYAIWGRDDIGGALSLSQTLMGRYADYEAMNDYPDIRCFTGEMRVFVVDERSIITPTTIAHLARGGEGQSILAYDREKQMIVRVPALHPRVSGRGAAVVKIKLSNNEVLRVTPNHKVLTITKGYVNAEDLRKGDSLVAARGGFELRGMSILTTNAAGVVWVSEDPVSDGVETVYDVTTSTHNLLVNGVVCHNSAFHYFASDSTQPNMDNGRVVWVSSQDEAIRDAADVLLRKKLRLEDDLFSMAYTLCQYGDNYEEVLVTDNGVVGLNHLPPPTMRRVEKPNGALIGYVQDVTGRFTADQEELRRLLASTAELPPHVGLFEDWQAVHFRLRSTARRSPYGRCAVGDTMVHTVSGLKPIKDVKVGERVFCRHAGLLRTTHVVSAESNGIKQVFKMTTPHRQIRASDNHPFLVKTGPSTNAWRQLKDLKVGDEIVVTTRIPGSLPPPPLGIRRLYLNDDTLVRLTQTGAAVLRSRTRINSVVGRDTGLRPIFESLGITRKQQEDLLDGESRVALKELRSVFQQCGLDLFEGSFEVYRNSAENPVNLPPLVTPWFCRLFGFLLGDGWITKDSHQVCFARGVDEELNSYYESIFRDRLGLTVRYANGKEAAYVDSVVLAQALRDLGWIDGAHNKRIPGWVFAQSEEFRIEFINGLHDADGTARGKTKRLGLCNRALVHDFKLLVDSLGWTSGQITQCKSGGNTIKAGSPRANWPERARDRDLFVKEGTTYFLHWSDSALGTPDSNFVYEVVESIVADGEEEVFDIGVADSEHNFIAENVVWKNSIAEGGRWIWKRLIMLEDSVMIYRLCLRGDSKVWTPEGYKPIKEISEGDEVYSYTTDDRLKRTRVTYKKHNGTDTIYRVKSRHRDLYANATHPVLVEEVIGQGSGKPQLRVVKYVEVQHLDPSRHSFMTPSRAADDWEEVELRFNERANPEEHLEEVENWGGRYGPMVTGINVPSVVDEDFARWFGFMLGDGFITTRRHKDGYAAQNEVGFAIGADPEINEEYRKLFERYVGENLQRRADNGGRLGCYSVVSSRFAQFMLLNGFIPGAHNKRLPGWAFKARPSIKLALLRGLSDADGHIRPATVSKTRRRTRYERAIVELCNRAFLEDVQALCQQLGIVVTRISQRKRPGGQTIRGAKRPLGERVSYMLAYSFKPAAPTEKIVSIERIGTDDIYDIGVEADEHNFVADGVVVHNTRSPSRYAFYVDVTDVPANRVESFLRRVKRDLKKRKAVNPNTNQLDMRYNVLANDEDFVVAVRDGRDLSRVEMLSGPVYQSTDDLDHFKRMLHGALMVPRTYLGQDEAIPGRSLLSNEDARAARVSLQVQRELKNGIERLIRIDQAARGVPNPWQTDFDVMMTVPSNVYELTALEVKNARADFAARIAPNVSRRWLMETVYKFTDAEIKVIDQQRRKEAREADKMGMDPSFGPFTGGRPPSQEEQMAMQQQQMATQQQAMDQEEEGAPPDVQAQGSDLSPDLDPAPPPKNAPQLAWKLYDQRRRLEERRYEESRRNQAKLLEKLDELQANDAAFAAKMRETQAFLKEFRSAALRNVGGQVVAAPSARPQPRFELRS